MSAQPHKARGKHKRRSKERRRVLPGAAPGTLVPDPEAVPPRMSVMAYGPEGLEELQDVGMAELKAARERCAVLWIDVSGLRDLSLISEVGKTFAIHDLALEDVVNLYQRPKVEDYEDHLFIVTRMFRPDEKAASLAWGQVETEQISLFLGKDYVLTFQERHGDCFDPLRERLRRAKAPIRAREADYLAYALLDSVVDSYFPVLEAKGELLEELEDLVIDDPDAVKVDQIHQLRRDMLALRRAVWPQREMVSALLRDRSELIGETARVYLRDAYDHLVQLMDIIETSRELSSDLMDLYLSSSSARLNEVMKVLTVIATIFMPLGFVTGLYGMNFDTSSPWNMPELDWRYGYPYALGVMLIGLALMLVYFRRKRWIRFGLGKRPRRR